MCLSLQVRQPCQERFKIPLGHHLHGGADMRAATHQLFVEF